MSRQFASPNSGTPMQTPNQAQQRPIQQVRSAPYPQQPGHQQQQFRNQPQVQQPQKAPGNMPPGGAPMRTNAPQQQQQQQYQQSQQQQQYSRGPPQTPPAAQPRIPQPRPQQIQQQSQYYPQQQQQRQPQPQVSRSPDNFRQQSYGGSNVPASQPYQQQPQQYVSEYDSGKPSMYDGGEPQQTNYEDQSTPVSQSRTTYSGRRSYSNSRAPAPSQQQYEQPPIAYSPEGTVSYESASPEASDENPFMGETYVAGQEPSDAVVYDDGSGGEPVEGEVPLEDFQPVDDATFKRSSWYLYLMYFFSAWGDRAWEFAVVLFLIDMFPNTLFYPSFFGLVENIMGIFASPAVGAYVDSRDRLQVVRRIILGQNASIGIACIFFFIALRKVESATAAFNADPSQPMVQVSKSFLGVCYFLILLFGSIAKVASIGAKLSIHKDWVPVVCKDASPANQGAKLTALNSNMRRIDLLCSILAPLLIGLISLSTDSAAVMFICVWSFVSLFVEQRLVGWVYEHVPNLHNKEQQVAEQQRLAAEQGQAEVNSGTILRDADGSYTTARLRMLDPNRPLDKVALGALGAIEQISVFIQRFWRSMKAYYAHPVFKASFAYALLYISVLSLGGTMASYLKIGGVSNAVIGATRGIAAAVGVGATLMVPRMVRRWGVERAGLVSLWSQVICLLPVIFCFMYYFSNLTARFTVILIFLCLSRFGLWSFDLCETQIMQENVEQAQAGVINGAQETWTNICLIVSFLLTIIFSSYNLFAVPAIISFLAVVVASVLYTNYVSEKLETRDVFPSLSTFKPNAPDANPLPDPASQQQQQQEYYDEESKQDGQYAAGQYDEEQAYDNQQQYYDQQGEEEYYDDQPQYQH